MLHIYGFHFDNLEITCPPIDEIEHGKIQYVGRRKELITLGTMINVSCDYGYRTSGSPLLCEENGRWSQGKLACDRKCIYYLFLHLQLAESNA